MTSVPTPAPRHAPKGVCVGAAPARSVWFARSSTLSAICGPCVIESRDHVLKMAEHLARISQETKVPIVFKSSYDKANRTSKSSFRGPGVQEGLKILEEVRTSFELPVVTDVHDEAGARAAAQAVDLVQIPAFLCRQTSLLEAAGGAGKPVMIKKGQFVAPEDMRFAAEKVRSTGNDNVMLCERGSCFGYRDLVVDFRSLLIMRESGAPIVFDATHSVQQMGGQDGRSGGRREFVVPLARAAVAVGVDGVFIETHDNPDGAPSDGPNMLPLSSLRGVLLDLRALHELHLQTRNA